MIDQGTILDRIDFNIQDAKQKVEKANIQWTLRNFKFEKDKKLLRLGFTQKPN